MLKLLPAFSLLIMSLFLTPSYAVWDLDGGYEREGLVFPIATKYTKEKNENGQSRRSPKIQNELSLATVQLVSPGAILYFKYYEIHSPFFAVQSFNVTPNSMGLTTDSKDVSSMPTVSYGSIPVTLDSTAGTLKLLIFSDLIEPKPSDYGKTMAAAVHTILTQYIPSVRLNRGLPRLKQITVSDSDASIAAELARIGKSGIPNYTLGKDIHKPNRQESNDYWEMNFSLGK